MRGGDRGYRGRGGEREGGQTKSSGKRGEDICTINNQIPAAALVQPLCLSLCPSLPSFFFLHPSSFPSFYPLLPESPSQSPVLHPLCFRSCPLFTFPSPPSAFTSSDASHPSSSHPPLPPRSIRPFVIVRLHHNPAGFFFFLFLDPTNRSQSTANRRGSPDWRWNSSGFSSFDFCPRPNKVERHFSDTEAEPQRSRNMAAIPDAEFKMHQLHTHHSPFYDVAGPKDSRGIT